VAERKTELLQSVEVLSRDEADRVCLALELIPREDIFNRSIDPKKVLHEYTAQVSSDGECTTIERALQEIPR
jgi:hypothetical protein